MATIKKMSPAKGRLIALLAISVLVVPLAVVGAFLSAVMKEPLWETGSAGVLLGFGIYFLWGYLIVPQNEFRVVERLGEYYETKEAGLRLMCLPGLIDRIAPHDGKWDYKWHRIGLYKDEGDLMDFTDGSAKASAQVWYRVNPVQTDAAAHWTYAVDDSPNRIEELFDAVARPLLQKEIIDSAQKNLDKISQEVMKDSGLISALEDMGVEQDPQKGFLLTDI